MICHHQNWRETISNLPPVSAFVPVSDQIFFAFLFFVIRNFHKFPETPGHQKASQPLLQETSYDVNKLKIANLIGSHAQTATRSHTAQCKLHPIQVWSLVVEQCKPSVTRPNSPSGMEISLKLRSFVTTLRSFVGHMGMARNVETAKRGVTVFEMRPLVHWLSKVH